MNKEQVLKIVSKVLEKRDVYDFNVQDFLSQLSLALDKEGSQAMKDFARSIVEQSVPSECKCLENAIGECQHNKIRSQTLSNADNLLK